MMSHSINSQPPSTHRLHCAAEWTRMGSVIDIQVRENIKMAIWVHGNKYDIYIDTCVSFIFLSHFCDSLYNGSVMTKLPVLCVSKYIIITCFFAIGTYLIYIHRELYIILKYIRYTIQNQVVNKNAWKIIIVGIVSKTPPLDSHRNHAYMHFTRYCRCAFRFAQKPHLNILLS